jgi:Domain of unknown function (DUF1876)
VNEEVTMSQEKVWTLSIAFTEDDDKTRADAFLAAGALELRGWGRSRRNPVDPDVPAVGEEIAAARALHDIADKLLERAAHLIEDWEGRPVHLRG